ncbi:FtsX-like permease family protein [Treponema phagedenis]|uniref:FtsX-like permease family protein n=1 Tax=Treponema phagedenis TaxID=162 RepID=UPI0001F639EC|nr:ABC transporter permease [Treponema phagedenis]EFW39250.1 efflux ABC transporter, permease protein [Treponema phagedenis F0421]TYT78106.1 ABC transporter permease [Treponema phagedenis]
MRKNNFRTFRGTSNAIFISYILLFTLLTMITIYVVKGDFNYYRSSDEIKVTYCLVDNDDQFDCSAKAVFKPLTELREISSFYYYLNFEAWFKCSDKMLSETFKKESKFEVKHNGRYFLNLKNPGERRLTLQVYGIDDVNFKKLLEAEGEDVNSYYQKNSYKAIIVNKIQKDCRIAYRNSQFIPFLNSDINKIDCYLSNKLEDDKTEIKIGKLIFDTDKIETKVPGYSVLLLMPIEKAKALRNAQIKYDKGNNEFFRDGEVYRFCLRTDEKNVLQLRNEIDEIIKPQLRGRNEYWTTDIIQEKVFAEIGAHFLNTVFLSFMLLVLFAGCINSYSTIKTNLNMRRREFAILRSVGADGKTIEGIFFDEAKYFIISPLLKALPVCVIIAALVILRFDIIFVGNFIAHFNWLFFFLLCIMFGMHGFSFIPVGYKRN